MNSGRTPEIAPCPVYPHLLEWGLKANVACQPNDQCYGTIMDMPCLIALTCEEIHANIIEFKVRVDGTAHWWQSAAQAVKAEHEVSQLRQQTEG
jgi:hypothetical protein